MTTPTPQTQEPLLLTPKVFQDERGYFFEVWREESIPNIRFVQENHSFSHKGVVRGLHYQRGKDAQGKLVWVSSGTVFDVFVDLRRSSPDFGKWKSVVLDSKNPLLLWIPPGFAHGFEALSKGVLLHYKCTQPYKPESERTLLWNDPALNIPWKTKNPVVSQKDKNGKPLHLCETFP